MNDHNLPIEITAALRSHASRESNKKNQRRDQPKKPKTCIASIWKGKQQEEIKKETEQGRRRLLPPDREELSAIVQYSNPPSRSDSAGLDVPVGLLGSGRWLGIRKSTVPFWELGKEEERKKGKRKQENGEEDHHRTRCNRHQTCIRHRGTTQASLCLSEQRTPSPPWADCLNPEESFLIKRRFGSRGYGRVPIWGLQNEEERKKPRVMVELSRDRPTLQSVGGRLQFKWFFRTSKFWTARVAISFVSIIGFATTRLRRGWLDHR